MNEDIEYVNDMLAHNAPKPYITYSDLERQHQLDEFGY